jgi:hypothetical protein
MQELFNKLKPSKYMGASATFMSTLKEVLDFTPAEAKAMLVRKEKVKNGPMLRQIYHTQDNNALVRKIFLVFLKNCIAAVVLGMGEVHINYSSKANPVLYRGFLPTALIKVKVQSNRLNEFDKLVTGGDIPYIRYSLHKNSKTPPFMVYINKTLYKVLVKRTNEGEHFYSRPLTADRFYQYVYEAFPLLEETALRNLVKACMSKFHMALKSGQEIKIQDMDGEIRFFRPIPADKKHFIMKRVEKEKIKKRFAHLYGKYK